MIYRTNGGSERGPVSAGQSSIPKWIFRESQKLFEAPMRPIITTEMKRNLSPVDRLMTHGMGAVAEWFFGKPLASGCVKPAGACPLLCCNRFLPIDYCEILGATWPWFVKG